MKRKPSLDRLQLTSIRTQIILGFGIILGLTLIIVVINFFTLRNLQVGIETTVEEASRVRELSQEFQNQFLLARQAEKAFLDDWRRLGFETAAGKYVTANQMHVAEARTNLQELNALVERRAARQISYEVDEIALLGPALDEYETAFLETVGRIEERSRAGGLELQLENAKSGLENHARTIPNSIELNRTIAQMDASEQAFFSTGEQQYVDQTRLLALKARDQLNSTPHLDWAYSDLTRPRLLKGVDARLDAFTDLVRLEQEIDINSAIFQDITTDISEQTDHIGKEAAGVLTEARSELRQTVIGSTILSVVAGLVALGIGVVTASFLARRIFSPLNELIENAQLLGQGNLNVSVSVKGRDEFATLGQAFNQMAGQLRDLIGSLEQRVDERTRALATSFQVSRRLSTILDQRQLVSTVVEQVRSTFDYYHVHIYLFDEERKNLIMVGGTGEAGKAMLIAGHKLRRGQGLVGQAAERREPVIVPEVAKDPNWLPNPLLPGTRAEIAVPIMLGDRVQGVLDVQHNVPGGLGQNDADLLQTIANQVAIAIQNAQLYEAAQLAAERETTVNVINQKIQRAGTVDDVLRIAAQELGKALNAQRTSLHLEYASRPGNPLLSTEDLEDDRDGNGRSENGRRPMMTGER